MIQETKIPSHDQAIHALEIGDDDTVANAVFAFIIDDGYYVERVTTAVRSLLKRTDLTPDQNRSIERALHGLGRMPLCTPGLDIHISLVTKGDSGAMSYDFFLSSDRFATESSGYFNSGYGSDSFSGPRFEVETHYREYSDWSIDTESWPDVFSEALAYELEIVDCSEDSLIDWEHPDGLLFWEWIETHD